MFIVTFHGIPRTRVKTLPFIASPAAIVNFVQNKKRKGMLMKRVFRFCHFHLLIERYISFDVVLCFCHSKFHLLTDSGSPQVGFLRVHMRK